MEITCEMQVDVLHRNNLCISASCCSSLHSEARSERWLSKCYNSFFADLVKTQGEAYRYSGLSDTSLSSCYGCHEDKFALCNFLRIYERSGNLGHIMSILSYVISFDSDAFCDFGNPAHFNASCDFNICLHLQ